jgi:hypothetical protein
LISKGLHAHRGTRGCPGDSLKVGNNEEINEEGREGLMMLRNEEGISKEEDEFGVFHNGRRYTRLKIRAKKGDPRSEYEWKGPCATVHIIEIPHTKGEEEES